MIRVEYVGKLTDARKVLVFVERNGVSGWMGLSRSLRPVVQIPGLTRVPVLWTPDERLDMSTLPRR